MKQVHVLSAKDPGIHEYFLTPLLTNRQLLQDAGVRVRILHEDNATLYDADIVIVASKFGQHWPRNDLTGEHFTEITFSLLEKLKQRVNQVFWFDTSDSTGSNQFRYLPYVDKFLKAHLLKDITAYQRHYYRDRIYTDYYHRHFSVTEAKEPPRRILPKASELPKIQLAWSGALGDFGPWAPHLRKMRYYLPLPVFYSARFVEPCHDREIDVNMRFSTNYNRATVAFQRQQLEEKAIELGVPTNRIPRKQYLKELRHSKVAVSPFGWGEVCFRDYEIILSGSLLVKPDMSHMVTWPNLYIASEAYIPFKWDFSDFESVLDESVQGEKWIEIARQAQSIYRKYLFEREGRGEFCKRFLNIVGG